MENMFRRIGWRTGAFGKDNNVYPFIQIAGSRANNSYRTIIYDKNLSCDDPHERIAAHGLFCHTHGIAKQ
jgi:hypothetical protein